MTSLWFDGLDAVTFSCNNICGWLCWTCTVDTGVNCIYEIMSSFDGECTVWMVLYPESLFTLCLGDKCSLLFASTWNKWGWSGGCKWFWEYCDTVLWSELVFVMDCEKGSVTFTIGKPYRVISSCSDTLRSSSCWWTINACSSSCFRCSWSCIRVWLVVIMRFGWIRSEVV